MGDTLLTDASRGFRVEVIEPERVLALSMRGAEVEADMDISAS